MNGLIGLYGFFDDLAVFKIVSVLPGNRYVLAGHTDEVALANEGTLLNLRLFVSEHAAVTAAADRAKPTPAPAPTQAASPVSVPASAAPSSDRPISERLIGSAASIVIDSESDNCRTQSPHGPPWCSRIPLRLGFQGDPR